MTTSDDPWLAGGSIFSYQAGGPVTVEDCVFEGNRCPWRGGAICVKSGWLTVRRSQFIGNISGISHGNGHGGAIYTQYTDLHIEDTVFENNELATGSGGAIMCYRATGVLKDCRFVRNNPDGQGSGGAIWTNWSFLEFLDCQFLENVGINGAAIRATYNGTSLFRDCLFARNTSTGWGSVLISSEGCHTFEGCTIVDNIGGGSAIDSEADDLSIDRSIIQGSVDAAAVTCYLGGSQIDIQCTNIYGNTNGDWFDCIAHLAGANGNFSADALFCDPENGDYTIRSDSPCAPPGVTGCGLVGALPVGCGPVSVEPSTWGRIKNAYR
jgi:hypothetical protein